jgi:hypothetical protein
VVFEMDKSVMYGVEIMMRDEFYNRQVALYIKLKSPRQQFMHR